MYAEIGTIVAYNRNAGALLSTAPGMPTEGLVPMGPQSTSRCLESKLLIPSDRYLKGGPRPILYCSKTCRNVAIRRENHTRSGVPWPITTGSIGAATELLVSADLTIRGFHVYRAVSPSCPCDLVILKDNQLVRVEVKSATKTAAGKLTFSTLPVTAEILAVVLRDRTIYYYPPFQDDAAPPTMTDRCIGLMANPSLAQWLRDSVSPEVLPV